MERLILLRHGKAEAGSPSGEDFDRALTERGRRDAVLMAQAIVSTAARARQTWEAAAPAFPRAEVVLTKALYNADPDAILAQAEAAGGAYGVVMVVAHNPGLHQLALDLLRRCKGSPDQERLHAGFPTGAAAAFDLAGKRFSMFTPKSLGGGA